MNYVLQIEIKAEKDPIDERWLSAECERLDFEYNVERSDDSTKFTIVLPKKTKVIILNDELRIYSFYERRIELFKEMTAIKIDNFLSFNIKST